MKTFLALLIITFAHTSCGEEEVCCKTCTTGKACGDSCISKTDTCTIPSGCACDG